MEHISQIITAIGVIIAAWLSYNQYAKNQKTDHKIEQWKADEQRRSEVKSDHIAKIYGELWRLLHGLNADRVHIVQPHPLISNHYVSITFEVDRNGVNDVRRHVQSLPMCEIPGFGGDLARMPWLYIPSIDSIKDFKAKSIMGLSGTSSMLIRRLANSNDEWTGSLFLEFTSNHTAAPVPLDILKASMLETATILQHIIPPYNP